MPNYVTETIRANRPLKQFHDTKSMSGLDLKCLLHHLHRGPLEKIFSYAGA